ncbi:UvrD-helicase domain-containing protein, partial [bacterium]|nr:UvrD-helicase domain-containing protein [bacterium]
MKKPLKLSDEKLQTIDVSRSCVVSAGAGSGKTVVLVARYLRLLVNGVEPRRIVAMTFTNKAAAELRHRVDEAISYSLRNREFEDRPLSEIEWQRLFAARQELSEGHLGTIHSFCHRLLREEPTLLPKRPFAGELDQAMMRQFRQDAEGAASTAAEPGGALERLLGAGVPRWKLREVTVRLLGRPVELAAARKGSARGFEHHRERLDTIAVKKLLDFQERLKSEWWEPFKAQLSDEKICEHFSEKGVLERLRYLQRELTPFVESSWDSPIDELARRSRLHTADFRGLNKRTKLLNKFNVLKEFKDLLEELVPKKIINLHDEERAFELSGVFLDWMAAVEERYLRLKERAGVVDFDDQIDSVARGVEEDGDFCQRQRKRYQHFLIDEFQDTDPRQWEIIRHLSEPTEEERSIGGRTLFIVGDRKQAIYGFRGGDNTVFDKASRYIQHNYGGEKNILMQNWRSRDGVLDFVNPFFELLFQVDLELDEPHPTAVEPQRMIRSRPEGEDGSTLLVALDRKLSDKPPEKALETAEVLADLLNGVIDGIYPGDEPEDRQRWIGVLTRTHNQINLLSAALEHLGLGDRFSLSKGKGLLHRKEVGWLRATLKALYDRRDEVAL